jgi:hypothetical protein
MQSIYIGILGAVNQQLDLALKPMALPGILTSQVDKIKPKKVNEYKFKELKVYQVLLFIPANH